MFRLLFYVFSTERILKEQVKFQQSVENLDEVFATALLNAILFLL